jgi:hypothetical protein
MPSASALFAWQLFVYHGIPENFTMISKPESDIIDTAACSVHQRSTRQMLADLSFSTKSKMAFLVVLAVAHVGITFWYAAPGPLLVDEAIYHWMAKSFSDSGKLDVWNGYEEIPSPELRHRYIRARGDKLFPQYPSLFAVLAFPFYRVFGFFGLFVMNALAFAGVVMLSFLVARKLFHDLDLALNSCLILILATFAWEYSQAAWPHAFGLLFVMGAFSLGMEAYCAPHRATAMVMAAACGAIGAIGLGMRLDGILVFPALILPFLFASPWRPLEALMVGAASIPALLPMAVINHIKFGVIDPFSYGEGPGVQVISPWPVAAAAAVVMVVWAGTRQVCRQALGRHYLMVLVATAGAVLLAFLLFTPAGLEIHRTISDAYICVVDVRALPADVVIAARTSGGGVIYVGAHKKALLQSMPYVVLLLIPLLRMTKPDKDFSALAVLFLTPLAVIGFYAYSFPFHDMGGLCLNTRYFLPMLPFVAILCAYAVRELQNTSEAPSCSVSTALIFLTVTVLFLLLTKRMASTLDDLEFPLLTLPLCMAGLLLVFLSVGQITTFRWAKAMSRASLGVAIGAMVWASLVALGYDYPAHRFARAVHFFFGQTLLKHIPSDSIVFADNMTFAASTSLIDKNRVRIAFPPQDKFRDFDRLLNFQLQAGRRSFALFNDKLWDRLKTTEMQRHFRITPVVEFHDFTLSEISFASTQQDAPAIDLGK